MSVTLNNVSFGDSRRLETNLISQETINQQHIVFDPSTFFDTQVLTFEYINVDWDSKEAFIAFLAQSAGLQIHLQDYEGHKYLGFIITPIVDVKPFTRNVSDSCKGTFSIKFDFAITGTYE